MPRRRSKSQIESRFEKYTDRRGVIAVCLLVIAATWLVFGQTLTYDFVNIDDDAYVEKKPEINRGLTLSGVTWALTHSHVGNWHPLTSVSHMLDCQIYGLKAGGHHFTNVLLHTLAAILLFLVLREMAAGLNRTGSFWRSAFVALVFAIHPLRVESVAWISERKDVLSGVFFMLTLGAYVRWVRQPSHGRYVTILVLLACGLMSKPTLITVPFVLLLLDHWPLQRKANPKKLLVEKIPLFLLAAAAGVATLLAQTRAVIAINELPFHLRLGNALVASVIYIYQSLWPEKLAAFYPFDYFRPAWQVVLATSLLILLTGFALVLRKRRPYFFTGWFWYLGMLVPVIGLLQVGSQSHADRYTYLPQIGLLLIIGWGTGDLVERRPYRRQILGVAAVLAIAGLVWCAHIQTRSWRNSETLWKHALAVTTDNNVAHRALASFLMSANRTAEAIPHFERALSLRPNDPEGHNMVAIAFIQTGRPDDAVAHWKATLEWVPHDLNAESSLAWIFATSPLLSMRDGLRAIELSEDVVRRSGNNNPITLRTLAAAYAERGRFADAIDVAQKAFDLANAKGNAALAADLQRNIDNYKMNTPVRDPSLANAQSTP